MLIGLAFVPGGSAQSEKVVSSYGPINQDATFDQIKAARMAVKDARAREHLRLLNERYDLSKKTPGAVLMSGGKPVPVGPTARLHGATWAQFDAMTPDQIKEQGLSA